MDSVEMEVSWQVAARDAPLSARFHHALALVDPNEGESKVFAVGGASASGVPPDAFCELFEMQADGWTVAAAPPSGIGGRKRVGHACAVVGESLFLIGGLVDGQLQNDVLEYETSSDTWKAYEVKGQPPKPLAFHTATAAGPLIYVIGGRQEGVSQTTVFVYDPRNRTWLTPTVTGFPPPARSSHSSVLLSSSRIAVFGGDLSSSSSSSTSHGRQPCADLWVLELLDPHSTSPKVQWLKVDLSSLSATSSRSTSPRSTSPSAASSTARPIVICGPSGVGKGTLISRLMQEFPGRCGFSVSHTTRKPRPGEQDAVHYHFTSREVMEREIAEGKFLEKADVHGNLYGTSVAAVQKVTNAGKMCILDIDVQGAEQVKASPHLSALFIFVAPPNFAELEKRLRGRGTETEEAVQKRLRNAAAELERGKDTSLFSHTIINDDLDAAYEALKELIGLESAPSAADNASVLPPRSSPAIATLGSTLVIHGGRDATGQPLQDLHLFDLANLKQATSGVLSGARPISYRAIPESPPLTMWNSFMSYFGVSDGSPPTILTTLSHRYGHKAITVSETEVLFTGGTSNGEEALEDSVIFTMKPTPL